MLFRSFLFLYLSLSVYLSLSFCFSISLTHSLSVSLSHSDSSRLLWEVIKKNSTETHTAAAENKALNTFFSLHYNSKRIVVGRGKLGTEELRGPLQGVMSQNIAAFVVKTF